MSKIITIDFRSDTLFAVERNDGVYVAIKPICDTLGIDWNSQRDRIARNAVLSEGRAIMALPSVGGPQETVCLRLDLVNGWLFGIDSNRVKEECRDRVLEYQRECYRVLFEHFYGKHGRQPAAPPIGTDPRTDEPTAVKRGLVTECRQTFDAQSARELWFKLGLPVVPAMFADPRQGQLFSYTAIKSDGDAPKAA